MRAHRGFTLLEVAVVVAIVGIVAALAVPTMRAARRNANVSTAAFELGLWLEGLRTRAMRDQQDIVAIVLDVPNNDPEPCAHGADLSCGGYLAIRPSSTAIPLNNFDPNAITTTYGTLHPNVLPQQLPHGVRFHRGANGRASPPPYGAITIFDPLLVAACASNRACVGIRFRGNGEVEPVWPNGAAGVGRTGIALALGSELTGNYRGSHQHALAVTFPTGIVKAYGVAP